MNKKIIEAWGTYYPQVKNNLDSQGWYNGGNDKVQKTFGDLAITKSLYHQIPTSLLAVESKITEILTEKVIEEAIPLEIVSAEPTPVKKAASKAKKIGTI